MPSDPERLAREYFAAAARRDLDEAWPAHGEPLRGDVRGKLERTAE